MMLRCPKCGKSDSLILLVSHCKCACGYRARLREFIADIPFHAAFLKKDMNYNGLTLDEINGLCKMLGNDKAFIPFEICGFETNAYGFVATDFYAEHVHEVEDMTHHLEQVLSGTKDESGNGMYTFGPMRVFMGNTTPAEEETTESQVGVWLPIEKCRPLYDAAMCAKLFDWTDGKLSLGGLRLRFVNGSIWEGLLQLPTDKQAYVVAYMCEHLGLKAKVYAYDINWMPEFADRERYPSSIEIPLNEVCGVATYLLEITHGYYDRLALGVKVEDDERYHEIFKQ